MVASVDTHVFFLTEELKQVHERAFLERSIAGGSIDILRAEGPIGPAVERAREKVGGEPVGFVVSTESEALEAIAAGADDALALATLPGSSSTEVLITNFLDRLTVRARLRREAEKNSQDLAQAEKLTALGTLVAGVGHELNNPLSMITLGFDFLRDALLPDLEEIWSLREKVQRGAAIPQKEVVRLLENLNSSDMDVRDLLRDITEATDSVAQLVGDLRVFSRNNMVESPTFFSPRSVIEQALRLVRREFRPGTVIEQDYDDDLPDLYLPRNRLAQVVTNLLVNAAHAMREVERDIHQLRISARVDDQHLAISISDTGPGIPDEALERIFDPFFTTKREGQGTGLGLSISQSIINHMGGDLSVSSLYGDGATFICILPLPTVEQRKTARVPQRRPVRVHPKHPNRASVLLVDDDDRVLRATARALSPYYKLLIAHDGQEACDLLASGSHADAVITELELSELDGPGLYTWLKANQPRLCSRFIVATAAADRSEYQAFLSNEELVVLPKPLSNDELLGALRRLDLKPDR